MILNAIVFLFALFALLPFYGFLIIGIVDAVRKNNNPDYMDSFATGFCVLVIIVVSIALYIGFGELYITIQGK